MPVHKVSGKDLIGDKPIVMVARPFHARLKDLKKPKKGEVKGD